MGYMLSTRLSFVPAHPRSSRPRRASRWLHLARASASPGTATRLSACAFLWERREPMPPAVRTGLNASAVRLPNRRVLGDSVYEVIKGLVIDQRVEPGSRMNIDSLARQLTVSQTPIREALARLEADGLVIREPLRGYSVAPLLDASSFDQLYDMRLLLEPEAARHAARNIREEDFRPMEKAATELRNATPRQT